MEAIDGYHRAALSLSELPSDDQAWILEQLDEQDRVRVNAALQVIESGAALQEKEIDATPQPAARPSDESNVGIIASANIDVITAILHQQPDWVTAIVLASLKKTDTLQELMNQMHPEQAEQLGSLAKRARQVKQNVREIVLQGVADRIRKNASPVPEEADFESILATVNRR